MLSNNTTCTLSYLGLLLVFDFKTPLELEPAIKLLGEAIFLTREPTGYSYCSSELNQTIHIAQSFNHFATELPSLLQVKRFPAFLLELFSEPKPN
jgi:hypothetical protein